MKLLSVLLLLFSLWLTLKYFKKAEACGDCAAPAVSDFSDSSDSKKAKSFAVPLAVLLAVLILGSGLLKPSGRVAGKIRRRNGGESGERQKESADAGDFMERIAAEVLPAEGFKTRSFSATPCRSWLPRESLIWKNSELYEQRGGLSEKQLKLLTEPSYEPLVIRADNAGFLVNVLWAVGLANKTGLTKPVLSTATIFSVSLPLAAGGWGKEDNGGNYFNGVRAIELTPAQEAKVLEMAKSIYRPCCNNSTFSRTVITVRRCSAFWSSAFRKGFRSANFIAPPSLSTLSGSQQLRFHGRLF